MIRGRGFLAKALADIDSDKYLFYVNGISNSVLEAIPEDNFEAREIKEISKHIGNKTFVYISTIQVNSKANYIRPYVQHKYKMECLAKELFQNYIVVRTSNLVGHNPWNKHTLFNFLYSSLKAGTEVTIIESAIRNVLDVDHFTRLFSYYLDHYPQQNTTINIVNPVSHNMAEILARFESIFSRAFIKKQSEINIAHFEAPGDFSFSLVEKCEINLEDYVASIIKKYYPPIISFA